MKTAFCLVLLVSFVSLHSVNAFSDTQTVTYRVSLTIPNAIVLDTQQSALGSSQDNQPNQLAQTEQLVRNSRMARVTSIVAQ